MVALTLKGSIKRQPLEKWEETANRGWPLNRCLCTLNIFQHWVNFLVNKESITKNVWTLIYHHLFPNKVFKCWVAIEKLFLGGSKGDQLIGTNSILPTIRDFNNLPLNKGCRLISGHLIEVRLYWQGSKLFSQRRKFNQSLNSTVSTKPNQHKTKSPDFLTTWLNL